MLKKFLVISLLFVLSLVFFADKTNAASKFLKTLKNFESAISRTDGGYLIKNYTKKNWRILLGEYGTDNLVYISQSDFQKTFGSKNYYKVFYAKKIKKKKWNRHFKKVRAAKRGVVIAGVYDKDLEERIEGDLSAIFLVIRKNKKDLFYGMLYAKEGTLRAAKLIK